MNSLHRGRGFSLIELLVAIAVIGILSTLGALGISELRDVAQFQDAIKVFESSVAEGRRIAKSEDRMVTFSVEQDGSGWAVVVDGKRSIVKRAQFSEALSIDLEPPYGTAGYPSGASAEVDVTLGRRQATLHIVGVLARTVVVR